MSTGVRIAAALTRAWVRLYTIGMPVDLREIRRAEIDADLWDHEKDAEDDGVPPALFATEILLRAVFGVLDDLSWRFEAIRARRAAAHEGRIPMMAFSAGQIRWMGLGGLLSGLLWIGNVLTVPFASSVVRDYGALVLSLLSIVGLVGFYAQQRGREGKAGTAGFILLFTSFVAFFALILLGMVVGIREDSLLMNLLGVTFVFLLPPGFLLLGFGLKGPIRRVPLALGSVFVAWFLVAPVLVHYFPAAANFLRPGGDTPLGATVFFLMGIGLALIGYAVFRNAAPAVTNGRSGSSAAG